MLTALGAGDNIILTSTRTDYQLECKLDTGSWLAWDGTTWGGTAVTVSSADFTDYNLSDGVYQYRTLIDTTYEYSDCVVIGSGAVGWTFGNYTVPDGSFGSILTYDDLNLTYLFGIDTTASNGQAWTNAQTEEMIKWSVYQLEKVLNIDIYPRSYYCDDIVNEDIEESKFVIKEFAYPNKRRRQYLVRSRHRPIREVTRFDYYSPVDSKIMSLLTWVRTDKRKGTIWYYPKQDSAASYVAYAYPWNVIMDAMDYPDAFHLDYTTGYATAELIPEDLRDIIGKIAACKMLNVIGDGLLAGFSSSSISLDGLSESFSSTQSATNAYFGSRIQVYLKDISEFVEANKHKYGNFLIGSI